MTPARRTSRTLALLFCVGWTTLSCDRKSSRDGNHEHADHEHADHEHGDHEEKNSAKKGDDERHDHASEHPEGHDHHAEGHGHGDQPMVWITKWTDEYEVFAEHSPAVVGKSINMLVHLTRLDDFSPVASGGLQLRLEGPQPIEATANEPSRPGIYRLTFTPKSVGEYSGGLVLEEGPVETIDGLSLAVFADEFSASAAVTEPNDSGKVELLKEQQWGVPFGTVFARDATLVESTTVAGRVTTPPGGSGQVGAPVSGRVLAPAKGMPRPGDQVKKGQVLASLAPAPAAPEAAARANLAVVEAEARASRATAALQRAERLVKDDALPKWELQEAEREAQVATEAVKAAERARALFAGAQSGGSAGAWRLTSPIAGVLTKVSAIPGASVSPGDVLFEVIDAAELWITAKVPEQDAARLRAGRDAAYQIAGLDTWKPIVVSGETPTASLVSVASTVDAQSRTVDVIYSLQAPDSTLRVGGLVQVSLPTGDEFRGVVVPASAIVEDEGRQIAYVQVDGEHFVERIVRTGARSGAEVGITHGINAGERVVSRGAHLVRLADRASTAQPHGHIH